jgi:hypothetical protein
MLADGKLMVFGAAAGRCGTMTLANLLNNENNLIGLHEGMVRHLDVEGNRVLPALVLQNVLAYHKPLRAQGIFSDMRTNIPDLMKEHSVTGFADIAYYNAPFVGVISEIFPDAKLIVILRDGRDFVRAVCTDLKPDPMPAGWAEADKELSKVERFISLGRLRPVPDSDFAQEWDKLPAFERNAWLWNATYRLIIDGLKKWPANQVKIIRFEKFFSDPLRYYEEVRNFLNLEGEVALGTAEIAERRINERPYYKIPKWHEWDEGLSKRFFRLAGEMMEELDYV